VATPTLKRVLRLPLKAVYFDAIKSGAKLEEYRLRNPYWCKRIESREYDEILLTRGYPPAYMTNRQLVRPWRGYQVKTITHPHFGEAEVTVFAIRVN
jgi:hypothetical protein